MKLSKAEVGKLAKPLKGSRVKSLGVIQSIDGTDATVMFSGAGHDEVRTLPIADLVDPAVTEAFINELVSLNSAT